MCLLEKMETLYAILLIFHPSFPPPGPYGLPPKNKPEQPAGRATNRNSGKQETKWIYSTENPSARWMERISNDWWIKKKSSGERGREDATDGECAVVTSVDLSI